MCVSSDCTPTLAELIISLADKIGTNYWKFGVILLDDATGDRISAIENELAKNAERINGRVFQCWLKGEGRQPVTWATLVAVLRDTGLLKLAGDFEAKFTSQL